MALPETEFAPDSVPTPEPPSSGPRPGPGVLLAEDEEVLRRVLGQKLESEGFTVWLAVDGSEAVEVFRAHRDEINVALLDIHMPKLTGPEALTALRHIEPGLHCWLMTAWAGQFRGEELAQLGASRVLLKPFSFLELVAALRALCKPGENGASNNM